MEKNNRPPEPWTLALFVGGILTEALIVLLGTPFALAIVIFIAGAITGAWITARYNRRPP
jgi:membrane protein implicated in regulation of membrane protease activity